MMQSSLEKGALSPGDVTRTQLPASSHRRPGPVVLIYLNSVLDAWLPASRRPYLKWPNRIVYMALSVLALGLYGLATIQVSSAASASASAGAGTGASASASTSTSSNADSNYCPVINTGDSSGCSPLPPNFLSGPDGGASAAAEPNAQILKDAFNALAVLQNEYFNPARMTWPSAIDWTAAVVQTIVSGSMSTLSRSIDSADSDADWKEKENLLSFLHEQVVSAYFGQDAEAIKGQVFNPHVAGIRGLQTNMITGI